MKHWIKLWIAILGMAIGLAGCSAGEDGEDGKVYLIISSSSQITALSLTELGNSQDTYFADIPYEVTQSGNLYWTDTSGDSWSVFYEHEPNEGEEGKVGTLPFVPGEDGADGEDYTLTLTIVGSSISVARGANDASAEGVRTLQLELPALRVK